MIAIAGVLLALSASAAFALHAPADRVAAPATMALAVGAVAALAILAVLGLPKAASVKSAPRGVLLWTAAAGATAVAAPYLVSAYRYSDAPAGSMVAFVTTSLWGLLAVAAGAAVAASRTQDATCRTSPFTRVSGALLGAVAGAGILANWERPSSFNPIVRFGTEQGMMLLAGAVWIAGIVVVTLAVRRVPARVAGTGYAAGALAASVVLLPFSQIAEADLSLVLPYAATSGLATALAAWLALQRRLDVVGPPLLAAPVLLSGLTIVEQVTGVYGPRPLQVTSVLVASLLALFGIAASFEREPASADAERPESASLAAAGKWTALAAVLLALVAMAMPALAVTVHGLLASLEAFDVTFEMRGFESLGPWLALTAAVLAVAAWLVRERLSSAVKALAAIAASVAAVAPLGATPLHTWVTWIPPEVQQDYGTEYAYIVFERLPAVWLWAAGFVTLVSILLLARSLLFPSRAQERPTGAPTEARR